MFKRESYAVAQFNKGEVSNQNGAVGWLFDNGEFRPLNEECRNDLFNAGLIDLDTKYITANAYDVYQNNVLDTYIKSQRDRSPREIQEQQTEASMEMGTDGPFINILTGEVWS